MSVEPAADVRPDVAPAALAAPPVPADDSSSEDFSAADLLGRLSEGRLAPADLTEPQRRCCVAPLTFDGFSNAQTTALLDISDRTLRRDRAAIRRDNAMEPSLTLVDELMGEYHSYVLASVRRLSRLAGDMQQPAYARLYADEAIPRLLERMIRMIREYRYTGDAGNRLGLLRSMDPGTARRELKILEASCIQHKEEHRVRMKNLF